MITLGSILPETSQNALLFLNNKSIIYSLFIRIYLFKDLNLLKRILNLKEKEIVQDLNSISLLLLLSRFFNNDLN